MTDIALLWDNDAGTADFQIVAGDLAREAGLDSAVIISLFTDRRVSKDDAAKFGVADRRGWWGDGYPDVEGDQTGSRLWLLRRQKMTAENLRLARDFARESLDWLVQDKVASSVEVTAERQGYSACLLTIVITKGDATVAKYQFIWNADHE